MSYKTIVRTGEADRHQIDDAVKLGVKLHAALASSQIFTH